MLCRSLKLEKLSSPVILVKISKEVMLRLDLAHNLHSSSLVVVLGDGTSTAPPYGQLAGREAPCRMEVAVVSLWASYG